MHYRLKMVRKRRSHFSAVSKRVRPETDHRKQRLALPDQNHEQARRLSIRIAAELGSPRFYLQHHTEMERSRRLFKQAPMVSQCLEIVAAYGDCYGHGLLHVRKVAVDAGAIILIEMKPRPACNRNRTTGPAGASGGPAARHQTDRKRSRPRGRPGSIGNPGKVRAERQ